MVNLQLPENMQVSSAWLKDLAAKHPRIQHLSLTTRCMKITTDACEDPFVNFANLKSLALKPCCFHEDSPCCEEENEEETEDHRSVSRAVGPILDRLQITSLELSEASEWDDETDQIGRAEIQMPSHLTTPNLIGVLVNLRLDEVDFQQAEYLFYHCRRLETLRLDQINYHIDDDLKAIREEFPPLVESQHQMSPFLRSTTFGFGTVSSQFPLIISP